MGNCDRDAIGIEYWQIEFFGYLRTIFRISKMVWPLRAVMLEDSSLAKLIAHVIEELN